MPRRLNDVVLVCQENDEGRMRRSKLPACSPFKHSGFLRHPSFVLRHSSHAAFFSWCACLARPFVFFLALFVSSKLCCKTLTKSITLVGLGAFFGFSFISFLPASTFSSITSIIASR